MKSFTGHVKKFIVYSKWNEESFGLETGNRGGACWGLGESDDESTFRQTEFWSTYEVSKSPVHNK